MVIITLDRFLAHIPGTTLERFPAVTRDTILGRFPAAIRGTILAHSPVRIQDTMQDRFLAATRGIFRVRIRKRLLVTPCCHQTL